MAAWNVAEAKAKLSEVVDRALSKDTQPITRKGPRFFATSPLHGSKLKNERLPGGLRDPLL